MLDKDQKRTKKKLTTKDRKMQKRIYGTWQCHVNHADIRNLTRFNARVGLGNFARKKMSFLSVQTIHQMTVSRVKTSNIFWVSSKLSDFDHNYFASSEGVIKTCGPSTLISTHAPNTLCSAKINLFLLYLIRI